MRSIDRVFYRYPNDYAQAIEVLRIFTQKALRWLSEKSSGEVKDEIIGNFIARGTVCLDSIYLLWEATNYKDCWVLHRTLADRLMHLMHLIDQDEFVEFERWSFQRRYQMTEKSLSDPTIREKIQPEWLRKAQELQRERRTRYQQEPKSSWNRPRAEEVAKKMKLGILYKLAYDFPSTEVHPMADDGKEEFAALLGSPLESYGDSRLILHNSLILQFLLVQKGLGACNVLWRGFVSDFLEQWFSFFEVDSRGSLLNIQKILDVGSTISWCESRAEENTL